MRGVSVRVRRASEGEVDHGRKSLLTFTETIETIGVSGFGSSIKVGWGLLP